MLKQELQSVQQKLKESCSECERLQVTVDGLNVEVVDLRGRNEGVLSVAEISALEEELVLVKEKYAQLTEEKACLNKQLNHLQNQYNVVCNKSHNTMFLYIAPLVLMLLYLLISSLASWLTVILCLFFLLFLDYFIKIIKAT